MKRLFIAIIALIAVTITFHGCKKKDPEPQTIHIEGLFSLTENWTSLGINSKAALELAADDINTYLSSKRANFRLSVAVSNTQMEASLAETFFSKAKSNGTKFIIGPQSSAELAAIKPLVDAAEVIVVSQSSTAGSLAIAGDAIFRFCPSDKIEGAAIAATIAKKGFKGLVTVARDDAGNKGLQASTGAAFTSKGGQTAAITPYATTLTEYGAVIAAIKAQLSTLIAAHGADKAGVYLASFDEGAEIFKLAAADPLLSNVKWFGGDGVVLSAAFLSDPAVAEFVIKTSFFAPSFGLPVAMEPKWKPAATRIKTRTNIEADAFALAVYDAMWTIAYTLEANNGSTGDFATLKTLFVAQANKFGGIVGSDGLDEAGDRAKGTFDYFSIVKEGSTYVWKLVGKSED